MLAGPKSLSSFFGKIVALEDVSFEIEPSEFVFITGPSGAGKTTIVRLILREIIPTSGKIEVDQQDLAKIPSKRIPQLRQKIGVVFQDFKLLTDRTVFENAILPLEVLGTERKKMEKRAEEILKLVGLTERADLFPAQLAGGELQRACLARAVMAEPKILLADEPTGNLDPTTSWQIIKLMKKINKLGTTVVMATHNVDIVNSLRERVIKFDKGKMIKDQKEGKYEAR
jgi:cell division transport system ATP-binding protein